MSNTLTIGRIRNLNMNNLKGNMKLPLRKIKNREFWWEIKMMKWIDRFWSYRKQLRNIKIKLMRVRPSMIGKAKRIKWKGINLRMNLRRWSIRKRRMIKYMRKKSITSLSKYKQSINRDKCLYKIKQSKIKASRKHTQVKRIKY